MHSQVEEAVSIVAPEGFAGKLIINTQPLPLGIEVGVKRIPSFDHSISI